MFFKLCYIIAFVLMAHNAAFANSSFSKVYDEVDGFVELLEKHDNAKHESFIPSMFTETKEDIDGEIDEFLDNILELLSDNKTSDIKKDIERLTKENSSIKEEIAELSISRQAAESEKKFYELWKDTQNSIDKKIYDLRRQVKENELKIEVNKQKIIALLQNGGVNLSDEDIDSLLKTVTIYDYVDTINVLKTAHSIIANLQHVLETENENIFIARKYYGVFWLSTKAYVRQLEKFVNKIDNVYLQKLEILQASNNNLMRETKELIKQSPHLESNLKAQRITNEAIIIYRKVLLQQRVKINEQKEDVQKILAQVENTYKTVNIAHSLYESMDGSLSSYRALMSLPKIDVIPFKNTSIELKILELTEQMHQ